MTNVIEQWLAEITRKLKNKILFELLMLTSTFWVIISYVTFYKFSFSLLNISALLIAYAVFTFLLTKSPRYKQISQDNVLEHLNRQLPQLEESAQLIVTDTEKLPLLLQLQQKKVNAVFIYLTTSKTYKQKIVGKYRYKTALLFGLLSLVFCIFLNPLATLDHYLAKESTTSSLSKPNNESPTVTLTSQQIRIVSPVYTGLSESESDKMNIKAIVGAKIMWRLTFSHPQLSYSLVFSNGEQLDLVADKNYFTGEVILASTGLYQIKVGTELLPQIYTIEVINDQRPVIRILSPKLTITEISTGGEPIIKAKVKVSDDFGLSKVDILASIAKGSGESVKFRDQVFEFDEIKNDNINQNNGLFTQNNEYHKRWNLAELDMEPGDELYFTIRAWDNKKPEPQLTQSITKIVRWLEDSQQMSMSDGLLINIMPEYFKSQRQIIIETKQLIADHALLSKAEFKKTSVSLGVAQSDLKQKYGQYLGDEFEGEGRDKLTEQNQVDNKQDQQKNHRDETSNDDEHSHESAEGTDIKEGVQSAYQSVLAEYAHNHEDSDVGLMGKQDPVALMKRSVANMWEAELFLMLSKPEQALPYEEQALKFLKMANKAERIYVKRLGFEPPPVTESRRYQGELADIYSLSQSKRINLPDDDYQILSQAFTLVSQRPPQTIALTKNQRLLLTQVKELLNQQIKTRPALIEFVATIEKILLTNTLFIEGCTKCMVNLRNKIWQIMPVPKAIISSSPDKTNMKDELTSAYIENIKSVTIPLIQTNTVLPDAPLGKR